MGGGTVAVIVVVVVLVVAAAIIVPAVRRRQRQQAEHPHIGLPDPGELAADPGARPKAQIRQDADPGPQR